MEGEGSGHLLPIRPSSPTQSPDHGSHDSYSRVQAIHAIQDVASSYVGQLLRGCGSLECTETLCRTGKLNLSSRPLRRYTPRSARAIALTIASGPRPRARLCPRYQQRALLNDANGSSNEYEEEEYPQDRSSIIQQLCDSPAIRQLCRPARGSEPSLDASASASQESSQMKVIAAVNRTLDEWVAPDCPSQVQGAVDLLYEQILQLVDWCRDAENADIVCSGISSSFGTATATFQRPGTESTVHLHGQQKVLDKMSHPPSCRALCRIIDTAFSSNLGPSLAATLARLFPRDDNRGPAQVKAAFLCNWLKTIFLARWDGTCFLQGTVLNVADLLSSYGDNIQAEEIFDKIRAENITCIQMLAKVLSPPVVARTWLDTTEGTATSSKQEREVSNTPVAFSSARLEPEELVAPVHLLRMRRLLPADSRTLYFRAINHLKMQHAYSLAIKTVALREQMEPKNMDSRNVFDIGWIEEHYLLITVRRGDLVRDTFDQLWQRRKGELRRPLRVRLGEIDAYEMGHDLGGVQIEFFNLLCRELFSDEAQLFSTNPSNGYSYFQPASLQPLYMFELVGILFGLAIYNGITLPVTLPLAFYYELFGLVMDDPSRLRDYWPAVSQSLSSIRDGDTGYLEETYPLEANGLRMEILKIEELPSSSSKGVMRVLNATPISHTGNTAEADKTNSTKQHGQHDTTKTEATVANIADAWPGWHLIHTTDEPREINSQNKQEYVERYVHWLTYTSVLPQLRLFKQGFFSCVDKETVTTIFTPVEFKSLVEGTQTLDLAELRRGTEYEGYNADGDYIETFWNVVGSWSPEKQKQLVTFVTAVERIPAGGPEHLTFKIARAHPTSMESLPSSSTCFGTLSLPKYASRTILEEKLSLAIEYGVQGFGTG